MNSNDCIVVQGHIPYLIDVQGHLHSIDKAILLSLALQHLRMQNPSSYIILTGHGNPVMIEAQNVCNEVYWEKECRPLDGNGYVAGMPAQFWFIAEGIERAKRAGFTRILKTRLDCVIGIPNITAHCENILQTEHKRLLLTQQTCWDHRCGDCFLYGDIDILDKTFNKNNGVHSLDGLINTGLYAFKALSSIYKLEHPNVPIAYEKSVWQYLLKTYCAFRDTINLQFADLRWNGNHLLCQGYSKLKNDLLYNNSFDFKEYAWGSQWHRFDNDGNMTFKYLDSLISEKEFYRETSHS